MTKDEHIRRLEIELARLLGHIEANNGAAVRTEGAYELLAQLHDSDDAPTHAGGYLIPDDGRTPGQVFHEAAWDGKLKWNNTSGSDWYERGAEALIQ